MECTQVHLINVCFSPKIRLKLVKMALSSTMVSLGFYERVCEYVCFILLSVCSWNVIICILHAVPLNLNAKHVYLLPPIFYIFSPFHPPPSGVVLQSSRLWTWTPWWVRSTHGWRTQWSLRSLTALITPWRSYQSLTIRMMRKLISLLWKASCFTPTGKIVWSLHFTVASKKTVPS